MAPRPMTVGRPWRQSIASKLQLAFGLIAALTVVATTVAWMQFAQVDGAMERLTGRSLPAVKLSLALDAGTAEATAAAAVLARSNYENQRAPRLAALDLQMAEMANIVLQLRQTLGASPQAERLDGLYGAMSRDKDLLDRVIRERVQWGAKRERTTDAVARAVDGLARLLAPIADRVISDASLALEGGRNGQAGEPGAASRNALPLLQAVYEIRADVNAAANLLHQVSTVEILEEIAPLQARFDGARDRLGRQLAMLAERGAVDASALEALRRAQDALFALGEGDSGLFALRTRELRANAAARERQASFQAVASELGGEVNALVEAAETDAALTAELTTGEIDTARAWLVALAAASLLIAGLIVWLFVTRFIVRRLEDVSASMLAVAGGNLDAPLPAARPDELGDMVRALSVFRDNAREIRSAKEEAERARAAAEEASRTKSAFLANMSHELRTPLNAIIGYSEMLMEDAADRGDDASQADLRKIETAGKHLLGLINDILDLSKIEAGRVEIYLEPVEVGKLVAEIRTMVEPLMAKNGNVLRVTCPAEVGVMNTDVTKLRQSLLNILGNATKFTKEGTVALHVARATSPGGVEQVVFTVKDSGIGMTAEQMGRLFQAFTQADSSTTRNYGGTGLGLTITRHFCTMLGGSIDVASVPGEGSTFTITLPAKGPAAAEAPSAHVGPVITGEATGATVLVVDDDPVVHDVLSATLAKEGYRVVHARNGAEALRLAREVRPDAITLDVMMPQVDGWSVLGQLKSDPALACIPVIMLTIVDNRGLSFSLGASEFMTKPVDRARLVSLLGRFAGQPRNKLVLIADDDPDVRRILRATIEGAGMSAAEAANGREALERLAAGPRPALLLLDLMMPEVDGFGTLDAIRSDPDLADLPVVILTAKDLTEAERTFLRERATQVFSKGAQSVDSLGEALAGIIRSEPAVAA